MGDFLQTSLTKERRRIMSLKTCVKVVAPLLLVTLCTAAPYEASPSSTAGPPAPEKLVQTGKGVQCSVQYITIWDTECEDKPFEECETTYKEDCEYHWEIVGTEKVWAPIPGSCKKNPYDECHDVEKTHSK